MSERGGMDVVVKRWHSVSPLVSRCARFFFFFFLGGVLFGFHYQGYGLGFRCGNGGCVKWLRWNVCLVCVMSQIYM